MSRIWSTSMNAPTGKPKAAMVGRTKKAMAVTSPKLTDWNHAPTTPEEPRPAIVNITQSQKVSQVLEKGRVCSSMVGHALAHTAIVM